MRVDRVERVSRKRFSLFALPFATLLAACEGLMSGTEVARVPLAPAASGGYAPVKLALSPAMNPVALNLHAGFTPDMSQAGKWNTYRATLTRAGAIVFTREFSINYSGSAESAPAAAPVMHTMMILDIAEAGEHELAIVPAKPADIALTDPVVVVRAKVERPPK